MYRQRVHPVRHRVGLIGAGHISPYHASALARLAGVELAGIYDVDRSRREALAARLRTISVDSVSVFSDLGVDVIHVLTPPETHAEVALEALNLGAHVLVEKPLATDVADCERIGAAASERGLQVCVDHSLLYDGQIQRARETIRSGKIGRVVSVDILRSADYPPYEGGPLPPQYRSGGYPFRDLGIHQLYLLEALLGPLEDVRADWSSLGGEPNLFFDEWRAEVRCRDGCGYVHISFNVRPIQNVIIVQGTKGVLRIEPMSMFSTVRSAMPLPKTIERVVNTYAESLQCMAQVSTGVAAFARKAVRQYDGVQRLIAQFYRALDEKLPVPVTVEQATPIVYWVERVARAADAEARVHRSLQGEEIRETPLLVTGAAGALGSAIVARFHRCGESVRVFVRRRGARAIPESIEIATGDLGNPDAVNAAVRGARVVIHAGAATKGSWTEQRTSTVVGTRNIVNACLKYGVEQLVYISSLSVVDWAGARSGEPITETSALEPRPHLRGSYTRAKLEAEMLVRRAVAEEGLRAVILRPGQIFGGKLPLLSAAVARRAFGRYIVLGDGNLRLPLVYMEDVVDGVLCAIDRKLVQGEIVQLVDETLPTQNDIINAAAGLQAKVVRLPRALVFAMAAFSEVALLPLGRTSPFSCYRLRSALARRTYACQNAHELLGWKPRVGVRAAMNVSRESSAAAEHDGSTYASSAV
jgi:predicted dehydrogenase/nucleoside-diphosphate-sugar epimerase